LMRACASLIVIECSPYILNMDQFANRKLTKWL